MTPSFSRYGLAVLLSSLVLVFMFLLLPEESLYGNDSIDFDEEPTSPALDIVEQVIRDVNRWDPSASQWPADTWRAFQYIAAVQNPSNCSKAKLVRVDVGEGGGMGSKLQLFAKKLAIAQSRKWTVLVEGDLGGYTSVPACSGLGWSCLFKPISMACQTSENLARAVPFKEEWGGSLNDLRIPAPFAEKGIAFWWSVVQLYMFRLSDRVQSYVDDVEAHMQWSLKPQLVHIGMHIRLGDKQSDFSGQYGAYGKSAADYEKELISLMKQLAPSADQPVQVFVATDNSTVAASVMKEWPKELKQRLGPAAADHIRLLHAPDNATHALADTKTAMASLVESHPDMALAAGIEIVTDIYFLARSHFYFGLCMSQPTRLAVNLARARGYLRHSVAMDWSAADYRDFVKIGLDEGWEKPHDFGPVPMFGAQNLIPSLF